MMKIGEWVMRILKPPDDALGKDPRVNFRHSNFKAPLTKITLFVLLKFILPFCDFITDLQMVLTFGAPALGGYEICTQMSDPVYSGVNATAFGSVPHWTLNGDICGYIDGRYVPPVEAARRRQRRLREEHAKRGEKMENAMMRDKIAKKVDKERRKLRQKTSYKSRSQLLPLSPLVTTAFIMTSASPLLSCPQG